MAHYTRKQSPHPLSTRERQVCALLILNNGEIAERLGISENTVRAHIRAARIKLDVRSSENRVAFAAKLARFNEEMPPPPVPPSPIALVPRRPIAERSSVRQAVTELRKVA